MLLVTCMNSFWWIVIDPLDSIVLKFSNSLDHHGLYMWTYCLVLCLPFISFLFSPLPCVLFCYLGSILYLLLAGDA